MVQIPQGLDPRETNGTSGETSKVGLYVFEAKDEFDNKTGDKKYLEANQPAQADAFVHLGWRQASLEEVQDYVQAIEDGKKEARKALSGDEPEVDTLAEVRASTQPAVLETAKDSKQAIAGLTEKKETK